MTKVRTEDAAADVAQPPGLWILELICNLTVVMESLEAVLSDTISGGGDERGVWCRRQRLFFLSHRDQHTLERDERYR
ncbi:hypothetical protein L1987_11885 [Smallanthus sonchifolius]|uniref:Uncharacterized protein n=1 Tax=Smallanthus sonchifolius TaxID=185202 RepID=A0ACB9JFM1_9ASTR|nr:hypothetical protein L1987_11885 [Smallanthus sonchifolius]